MLLRTGLVVKYEHKKETSAFQCSHSSGHKDTDGSAILLSAKCFFLS